MKVFDAPNYRCGRCAAALSIEPVVETSLFLFTHPTTYDYEEAGKYFIWWAEDVMQERRTQ